MQEDDPYMPTTLTFHVFAGLGKAALWKSKIQQNAAALFSRRSADMQSLVYGTSAVDTTRGKHVQQVSYRFTPDSKAQSALQLKLGLRLNMKVMSHAVAATERSSHIMADQFQVELRLAQSCSHMGKAAIVDTISCIAHLAATQCNQSSTQPEADMACLCC